MLHFAAMKVQQSDAEYGNLIVVKRRVMLYAVVGGITGGLGALVLAATVYGMFVSKPNTIENFICVCVGVGLSGLGWMSLNEARTRYCFYEVGAKRVRGRRTLAAMKYEDVETFAYKQTTNRGGIGEPLSTIVSCRLKSTDGQRMRFSAYVTMAGERGFFDITGSKLYVHDALEEARDAVSMHMAQGMMERLIGGETIVWCGRVGLSKEGVIALGGRHKGTRWGYDKIQAIDKGGALQLVLKGEGKGVVAKVPPQEVNFWPCLCLFLELQEAIGAPNMMRA